MRFKSNGKLLITSEFLVMKGAMALAIPAKLDQELNVTSTNTDFVYWKSFDEENQIWYEEKFFLNGGSLIYHGKKNKISDLIVSLFDYIHKFNNPKKSIGNEFIWKLNFDRNWGLGSSSTLINNLSKWAKVNPYNLLFSVFNGSGYDIACCDKSNPIIFQKKDDYLSFSNTTFKPKFLNNLFLVFLNKKQNTQKSVHNFLKTDGYFIDEINQINDIVNGIQNVKDLTAFESLIEKHEKIIANILKIPTIQNKKFPKYNYGVIKSLGSWGGDFVLATGNERNMDYFREKGFNTVKKISDLLYV
jgi:mevalonate kinase